MSVHPEGLPDRQQANLWYYGWNIVGLTIVLQAVAAGIATYSFSFWVEPFAQSFSVNVGLVMMAAIALNLANAVYAPFIGKALDKYPARLLVSGGVALFAVGLLFIAMSTAFWQVVVLYATTISIGYVLAGPQGSQTITAKWFSKRRGLALGVSAMGTGVGGFVFPPLATNLIELYGWRQTNLIFAAGVACVLLPLVWIFLRERRTSEFDGNAVQVDHPGESEEQSDDVRTPVLTTRSILTNQHYWTVAGTFFALNFAFASVMYNVAPIAKDIGIEAKDAAYLMSAMAGSTIIGKLMFGGLADKTPARPLFIAVFLCMGSGVSLIAFAGQFLPIFLGVVLMGVSVGGTLPVASSLIASRFGPQNFGQVMGLALPALLVAIIGPAYAGWMRSLTNSYEAALCSIVVFLIPSMIVIAIFSGDDGGRSAK